jgi:hypothetical protein
MKDAVRGVSHSSSVLAVLEGGPINIPRTSRVQNVGPLDEKIKVPHYGGYEHFERTEVRDENVSPLEIVYRWTMRTEMAE